ncbi:hypothetical protein GCM10022287_18660 [Gryllotalpicola koreensis]|uniref:AAA+ ATPase domain-containing protein n=1 Tax=Gryllotalpicola koreensis TaxID=993086 RepID=A0ABP7ZZZ5_9MICO
MEFARHALASGRGLLVTGVAGVGKTHFLAELSRVMTDAGSSVLLTNSAHAVSDLAALEARHPIIIVDDAHRLDHRLLELLCDDAEHGAVTLCLAGPPITEVPESAAAALTSVVQAWLSGAGASRLRLPHLSADETGALARALAAPHELSAFWCEKIQRASGGLPALIEVYVADAVRKGRLSRTPELLDPESRELPPAEALEQLRPRLAGRERPLLTALTALGQLAGLPLDRAHVIVRRGDITALADAELLEIRADDDTVHVIPAVADLAASGLTAAEENEALQQAADAFMRFAPDGRRSPVEAAFLVRTWRRLGGCAAVDGCEPSQVAEVVHAAARLYTRAGRARQALELLEQCPHDALTLIEQARALTALHEHDEALARLQAAEPLVSELREARMLLGRYNVLLVWHLRDPQAFDAVAARAGAWLDQPEWRRELAVPGKLRHLSPRRGQGTTGTVPSVLAGLPAHRGFRATVLAAAGLTRVTGCGDDGDELLRMAEAEAPAAARTGSSTSALIAAFVVRGCRLLAGLIRQEDPAVLATALQRVIDAAVVVGGQSVENLAIATWAEALYA